MVAPSAQDAARHEVAATVGHLRGAEVSAAVEEGTLAANPGWRAWVLGELAFLEGAADEDVRAALDLPAWWARASGQPPSSDDPPDDAASAVVRRWRRAKELSPERALVGARSLLARDDLSSVTRTLLLVELGIAAREEGALDRASSLADRAEDVLASAPPASSPIAHEAVYLARTLRGLLELHAGRPDEAWRPLTDAHAAALAHEEATGEPVLRAASVVKRLDLAHASDDARGGRAEFARTRDAGLLERLAPLERLRIEWRAEALDLVDPEASAATRSACLDALLVHLEVELDDPAWPDERRVLASVVVRAALRQGRVELARSTFERFAPADPDARDPGWSALAARVDVRRATTGGVVGDEDVLATRLRDAVLEQVATARLSLDDARGRGLLHFDEQAELLEEALGALVATGRAHEALALVGRVQDAGSLARALGARTPEDLGPLVPADGGLLVLAPGFRVDHAFLVDATGTTAVPLPEARALHAARRALLAALHDAIEERAARSELERVLDDFSQRFLVPELAAALAAWRRVTVVGLAAWGDAPLELLELDGRRLGARLELGFAPSLPVAAHLHARPAQRDAAATLVVAVVADPGPLARASWPECVPLGDDASLADDLLGATRPRDLLLGEAGTLDAWTDALRTPPTLALVLAHGVHTPDGSSAVALFGSGPGTGLLTHRAVRVAGAPRTVLLAACEGARHRFRRGDDGRESLVAAHLLGGTECVLASSARLTLDAAVLHGEHVVDGLLRRGESPARALLTARLAAPDDLCAWTVRAVGRAHEAVATDERGEGAERRRTALVTSLVLVGALLASASLRRRSARARARAGDRSRGVAR